MPEGPEIRRAADKLESALKGKRIVQAQFGLERLKSFEPLITEAHVTRIETRGKGLLTFFDNNLVMYSHNQLYGKWVVCSADAIPVSKRQVRVALYTDSDVAILYSASDIEIVDKDQLDAIPFLNRVGPDILDKKLTVKKVEARLRDSQFSGRWLAGLLLDQAFLAGIGNYLRSEILFEAGLTPHTSPKKLSDVQIKKLAKASLSVSRRAYKHRGSCLTPSVKARVKQQANSASSSGDKRYMVFDRDGLSCRLCDDIIVKETLAGRRLYLCPSHQLS